MVMEKVNLKYLAVAAIVFLIWFSWFFRYDLGTQHAVLDRWSGSLIYRGDKTILSELLSDKEKSEARAKAGLTITPAPDAVMPVPDTAALVDEEKRAPRKGMFDDIEADMLEQQKNNRHVR